MEAVSSCSLGTCTSAMPPNHDVVNFFGTRPCICPIGQNVFSLFGSVHLGEDVSIGKDLVAMFGGGFRDAVSVSVVAVAWCSRPGCSGCRLYPRLLVSGWCARSAFTGAALISVFLFRRGQLMQPASSPPIGCGCIVP